MENNVGETSFQRVSRGQYNSRERSVGIVQQSIDGGVGSEVNMPQDNNQMTSQMMPSHLQFNSRPIQIAILHQVGKNGVETPLSQLIEGEYYTRGDCISFIRSLTRV